LFSFALSALATTMVVTGCGDSAKAPSNGSAPAAAYKKPSSGFTDTIPITGLSAVFFNADSVQLKKIKKVMPAVQYENDIHDCYYQIRNSKLVLQKFWREIQVIEASKIRFLLFISNNQKSRCIDLDLQNEMCGLYLFNGTGSPELADMTNIETALHFYFEKK
jgi:hypothetical protein